MKFRAIVLLALSLASVVLTAPLEEPKASSLEERSTTKINGNKVSVVSGLIITNHVTQCFQNSGVEMAKAYAAAIADQWTAYQNENHGTYWIARVEAQWASSNTANLFCSTFDAVYTFNTNYAAQVFATWVRNFMTNAKKRDQEDHWLAHLNPDVYVSDVDLPANHSVFGRSNATTTSLERRGWGSCSNSKCGFSFTSDQTGVCRDTSFPSNNAYYC